MGLRLSESGAQAGIQKRAVFKMSEICWHADDVASLTTSFPHIRYISRACVVQSAVMLSEKMSICPSRTASEGDS